MVYTSTDDGFKCSRCDMKSFRRCDVDIHIRKGKGCAGATVQALVLHCIGEDDTDTTPTPNKRMKPGPKCVDVKSVLETRIPMGDWDERIEYMFEKVPPATLKRHFKTDTPHSIMIWALKTLWCGKGPAIFQSFITAGPTTHELTRETPDDEVSPSCIKVHTKKRRLAKDVATWLTEFMILVCEDHRYIPHYYPDLISYANNIRSRLLARDNGVTLLDVMHRTKLYDLKKGKMNEDFKNEADRIIHDIRETLEESVVINTL